MKRLLGAGRPAVGDSPMAVVKTGGRKVIEYCRLIIEYFIRGSILSLVFVFTCIGVGNSGILGFVSYFLITIYNSGYYYSCEISQSNPSKCINNS